MILSPTASVMTHLRSISTDNAVLSIAANGARACGMTVQRFGACLAMLVSRGHIIGDGAPSHGKRRYTITQAGLLWLDDMTAEHVRRDDRGKWTDASMAKLRELWNANEHSTTEIGRRIGMSKNSVISKAHRMGLFAKPSPIVRSGEPRVRVARIVPVATLPPLTSHQEPSMPMPPHTPGHASRASVAARTSGTLSPFDNAWRPPVREPSRLPMPTTKTCQFIAGNGPPWVMCGEPSVRGSWCANCYRIVYHTVRRAAA